MIYRFNSKTKNQGFTLVELAIVLAVTGVLFLGLYRLLSGGNQQVKDSAVASQQIQLINAVKGFLASSSGAAWMGATVTPAANGTNDVASQNINLPLPATNTSNANCKASYGGNTNLQAFCDALPTGFTASTINAYGQIFLIQVQTGAITHPATAPSTYSIMIASRPNPSGTNDVISDADGGRISSQIGSDGGFTFSANVSGCTSPNACGAYGAWSASLTGAVPGFGFASGPVGYVVSRTYVAPELNSTSPWLARQFMANDTVASTTASPNYNTMTTDLFLGGKNLWFSSNNNTASPFSPLGTLNIQGGTVNLQNGLIVDLANNGNAIDIDALNLATGYLTTGGNYFEQLNSRCTQYNNNGAIANGAVAINGVKYWSNCQVALQINGDVNVTAQLQAGILFAGTFIYQSSDIRLKTDIQPIKHALDDVMRIKPVSFAFKNGGTKSLGVIAQDMETVYPQLVTQNPTGMKSVNYDGLVAPLVASVQELKRENDELRRQLKEQEVRQDRLEKTVLQKAN